MTEDDARRLSRLLFAVCVCPADPGDRMDGTEQTVADALRALGCNHRCRPVRPRRHRLRRGRSRPRAPRRWLPPTPKGPDMTDDARCSTCRHPQHPGTFCGTLVERGALTVAVCDCPGDGPSTTYPRGELQPGYRTRSPGTTGVRPADVAHDAVVAHQPAGASVGADYARNTAPVVTVSGVPCTCGWHEWTVEHVAVITAYDVAGRQWR